MWGPRVVRRGAPAPLANLLADNYKVPLTSFEQELGFAAGPARGGAARRNLRPVAIPGTRARLGIATSLPAFAYGHAAPGPPATNVALTYMRCLAARRQRRDPGRRQRRPVDRRRRQEQWQPLSWMGSAYRAVSDPIVRFTYAVNPFMVGNLADTPFDGQSAILAARPAGGRGCHYVGNGSFVPGQDLPPTGPTPGPSPSSWRSRPGSSPTAVAADLRRSAPRWPAGEGGYRYVQTAVIADLPFPADRSRPRLRGGGPMSGDLPARGARSARAGAGAGALAEAAARAGSPRACDGAARRPARRRGRRRRRARRAQRRHRSGQGGSFGGGARGARPGRRPHAQPPARRRRGRRGRRRVGRPRSGPRSSRAPAHTGSRRSRPTPRASRCLTTRARCRASTA